MMMRQMGLKTALRIGALSSVIAMGGWCAVAEAAPPERPTFNHTADPRPNILPNWVFNHHEPYRLQYNRPTYHGGKAMYYVFSPTSQEAMTWKENLDEGRYNGHHCPPVYKGYYYPKPWEIINTGPRPTYVTGPVNTPPVTPVAPVVPGAVPVVPGPPAPNNTSPKDASPKDADAKEAGDIKKAEAIELKP